MPTARNRGLWEETIILYANHSSLKKREIVLQHNLEHLEKKFHLDRR